MARSGFRCWLLVSLAFVGSLLAGNARAAGPADALSVLMAPAVASGFKICKDQTYALCATAKCFVFNNCPIASAT